VLGLLYTLGIGLLQYFGIIGIYIWRLGKGMGVQGNIKLDYKRENIFISIIKSYIYSIGEFLRIGFHR